ncbi:MAG TPA: methyltransferase domain-containing protein [Stellaceae bacterium]|nr:methyltransferase domain-containing protein [Stellaceae bacterium]
MTVKRRAVPKHNSSYRANDGAAYEVFLGRWSRRLAAPFLDFARFGAAGALLDAGCGTGSLALAMAGRWPGRPVLGSDIAAPYVAFARSRAASPGLAFAVGDLCRLPFETGRFAGAAAQLSLNFAADPNLAAGELRRVTRPGGVVAACIWDFRGGLVYQRLLWDSAAGIDPEAARRRDRLFSAPLALPDGLPRLFERAGLLRIERASLTIRMDYENFADYWRPLLGGQGPVGGYVAGLDPPRRSAVERLVRAAYLSGAPDGPRSLAASAWAARGVVPG